MLRVAICDDNLTICSDLECIVLKFQEEFFINTEVEVFYSGIELFEYLNKGNSFDLIFLDIEMDYLNGIQLGKNIRTKMDDYVTKIVYISSKDGYDRQLFDVQPMHFLSKPLTSQKVIEDLLLAVKLLNKVDSVFTYKFRNDTYKLPIKDILYFESMDREIKAVTLKENVLFYSTMGAVLSQVFNYQFIQIHRSYIVNYIHITKFEYDKVLMTNSDYLPISQGNRKKVRKLLLSKEKEGYL